MGRCRDIDTEEQDVEQDIYKFPYQLADDYQFEFYEFLSSLTDGDVLKQRELLKLNVDEFYMTVNAIVKRNKELNQKLEKKE